MVQLASLTCLDAVWNTNYFRCVCSTKKMKTVGLWLCLVFSTLSQTAAGGIHDIHDAPAAFAAMTLFNLSLRKSLHVCAR